MAPLASLHLASACTMKYASDGGVPSNRASSFERISFATIRLPDPLRRCSYACARLTKLQKPRLVSAIAASEVAEPILCPSRCPDERCSSCLLYTSDAADDLTRVDLGGRR